MVQVYSQVQAEEGSDNEHSIILRITSQKFWKDFTTSVNQMIQEDQLLHKNVGIIYTFQSNKQILRVAKQPNQRVAFSKVSKCRKDDIAHLVTYIGLPLQDHETPKKHEIIPLSSPLSVHSLHTLSTPGSITSPISVCSPYEFMRDINVNEIQQDNYFYKQISKLTRVHDNICCMKLMSDDPLYSLNTNLISHITIIYIHDIDYYAVIDSFKACVLQYNNQELPDIIHRLVSRIDRVSESGRWQCLPPGRTHFASKDLVNNDNDVMIQLINRTLTEKPNINIHDFVQMSRQGYDVEKYPYISNSPNINMENSLRTANALNIPVNALQEHLEQNPDVMDFLNCSNRQQF
jgi:hypothetical protein